MTRLSRYGAKIIGDGITLDELIALNREEQGYAARVENSGCEGSYVEVARWSMERRRWERFAFLKCFGGEYPGDSDLGERETAARFVADINDASWVSEDAALIHHMPNYVEDAVPVVD